MDGWSTFRPYSFPAISLATAAWVTSASSNTFFVDVEGTLSDPAVQNALKGISEEAATLRVLGNYEAQTDK